MPGTGNKKKRDHWWTWRWDTTRARDIMVPHIHITRWRRGSFLTVYKMETNYSTQWWLYGPFNLAIGFSYPTNQVAVTDKGDGPAAQPKMAEDGKYWN